MKKLIILLAALLPLAVGAAVPASVSRAADRVRSATTLDVECTLNGRAASMTLSGNCFCFNLGDVMVYYNGTTQWSYSRADSEVTILNPTAEELAESNPLGLLRNLERDFNGSTVNGRANTVRLTPRDPRSPIGEVTVTFDPASGWPTHMTVIIGGNRAEISNLRFTPSKTKKPAEAFTFSPPKGVTITDLR